MITSGLSHRLRLEEGAIDEYRRRKRIVEAETRLNRRVVGKEDENVRDYIYIYYNGFVNFYFFNKIRLEDNWLLRCGLLLAIRPIISCQVDKCLTSATGS